MLLYFSLTLFVSAALLFFVQPMIGKMILPTLGGTPAVWNTCMLFYQAMLLVGYAYTHTITTYQSRRRQLMIQSALLLLPPLLFMLPFSLGDRTPPTEENPVFWLLWLLLGVVGLPFFLVATSAPLLQKWFATTGHPAAKDPYFLYGASNLGSMLGLLLYPILFEPLWDLETQALVWTAGYAVLIVLVAGCAYLVWRTPEPVMAQQGSPTLSEPPAVILPKPAPPVPETAVTTASTAAASRRGVRLPTATPAVVAQSSSGSGRVMEKAGFAQAFLTFLLAKNAQAVVPNTESVSPGRRLRWVLLAAAPSSLMLGVTTYLTTDIAAVPLLLVVPLALYLMTFILVFARWPVVWTGLPHTVILYVQPCCLLFLVLRMVAHLTVPTWGDFLLHLTAFFTTTLLCHGELAKDRPSTRYLTEFYLWMAVGGVLGGIFNALVAPMLIPYLQHLRIPLEGSPAWLAGPITWFDALVVDVPMLYGIVEYPLAMVVACLLRPSMTEDVSDLGSIVPAYFKYGWHSIFMSVEGREVLGRTSFGTVLKGVFDVLLFGMGMLTFSIGVREKTAPRPGFAGACGSTFSFVRRLWPNSNLLEIILDIAVPIAFAVFAWKMVDIGDHERQIGWFTFRRNYLMAATVVVALAMAMRPVRFGLSVGLLFVVVGLYDRSYENVVFEDRGFFGLARVREIQESYKGEDGKFRVAKVRRTLIHGGINHGQQLIWPPEMRRQPITYFHPSNGIGEIYHKLTWGNPPNPRTAPEEYDQWMKKYREIKYEFFPADSRLPASMVGLAAVSPWAQLVGMHQQPPYAVVGLGTGTLAVHAQPFQHVDFFEIDPMVKRLSVPPPGGTADDLIFYYVDDARKRGAYVPIILGDGRLKIKEAPEKYYHAISLDAFSSDAIPIHLLTRDAVEEYLKHLADGGVLIFNTTNRYVRIQPVLAAIAEELGMECLACPDWSDSNHPEKFGADWTVLRRSDKQMDGGTYRNGGPPLHQRLDLVERWEPVEPLPGKAWTDKYSNLLRVMKW